MDLELYGLEPDGFGTLWIRTLSKTSFHYDREREILAWVQFHTPRSWVLVGDGKDLGKEFEGHFVRTDAQCGLSVDDANRIICSMIQ